VVVDPVDGGEGEGEEIEEQRGDDGAEAGRAVCVGNLELEHHDGDDDGDDAVGEGFEAGGWGGRRHEADVLKGSIHGRLEGFELRLLGYAMVPNGQRKKFSRTTFRLTSASRQLGFGRLGNPLLVPVARDDYILRDATPGP